MEKIIHKLINEFTEGVNTYTHNNSTWLIFTETKQWVIELTDNKTLWYNYNFFKSVFAYASLDCVQNQHLITKWVEDNIINGVKQTSDNPFEFKDVIENTIENGVKHTKMAHMKTDWSVEDTIENGVKETKSGGFEVSQFLCEEVIDKGVKETKQKDRARLILDIDGRGLILETNLVIRDGVKETNHVDVMKFFDNKMEDALQNGVKETNYDTDNYTDDVNEVIREGVKETSHRQYLKTYDVKDTTQDGTEHDRWILDGCDDPVDVVLDNGVKITTPLQSREYTGDIDEVLGNGIKSSIPRQYVGENIIDKIIDKGVIETHREICEYKHTVDYIIQTGVKETIECDWNIPKYVINEVISEGVKKTMAGNYTDPSTSLLHIKWETQIEDVIDNGNKVCGTYVGGHRQEEKTETVIEYGKQI